MARTKKSAAAAPEAVQEAQAELAMGMDTPGAQEAAEGLAGAQVIGPADEAELLGCQDEEARELGYLQEYIVRPDGGLNMRMEPNSDADILAVLPCDSGVTATGTTQGPWMEVVTGRLVGWVLAEYLEPLAQIMTCGDG